MSRVADRVFPEVDTVFDPALYTNEELQCIERNLGDPPGVARSQPDFPDKPDSIAAVVNALQRFYDLEVLQERGVEWKGKNAVREHIGRWLERQRRYKEHKQADPEGKGFHPEQHTFDSKGKAHWAGPGSCSGRVRSPFELMDIPKRRQVDFTTDSPQGDNQPRPQYARDEVMNHEGGYVQCPICENKRFDFNNDSKSSENSAWARYARHCLGTQDEPDEHRRAHEEAFS